MADRNKNRNKSGFLQKLEWCRKTEIGLYPAKFCRGFNGTLGFFLPWTVGEKTTFFWDPVESKHRLGDVGKFGENITVWDVWFLMMGFLQMTNEGHWKGFWPWVASFLVTKIVEPSKSWMVGLLIRITLIEASPKRTILLVHLTVSTFMVDMQVNWLFNALLFYVPDTYQNTYVEMYHCARLSVNKVTYGRSPIIHEGVVMVQNKFIFSFAKVLTHTFTEKTMILTRK